MSTLQLIYSRGYPMHEAEMQRLTGKTLQQRRIEAAIAEGLADCVQWYSVEPRGWLCLVCNQPVDLTHNQSACQGAWDAILQAAQRIQDREAGTDGTD